MYEAEAAKVEREIIERIATAKLRLRFDRVVLRLVGGLKAALADIVPEDQVVILTITAPIRRATKTAAVLENLVRSGLPDDGISGTIHDNQIRLRRIAGVPAHTPRVLGFVHNPESDAGLILALAESRLLGRDLSHR